SITLVVYQQLAHVILERIDSQLLGLALARSEADVNHQPLRGVTEGNGIRGIVHVPVVVDPGGRDDVFIQSQQCIRHQILPVKPSFSGQCSLTRSSRRPRNSWRRYTSCWILRPAACASQPATARSISSSVSSGASSLVHGSFSAGPNCANMWRMPSSPPARWKVRKVPISAQRRPAP